MNGVQAVSPNLRKVGQVPDEDRFAEAESVHSRQRGKGKRAPAPEAQPAVSKKRPRRTVLIVEDTTELAEVIAATLERINIRSLHETHVDRALAVYSAEHPDVILLDIGLPDKNGWKLLDAIRQQEEKDRPAVVVITAHGDPANRLMGKLQGVHSYLIKPFTPNEVERVVNDAFAAGARNSAVPRVTVHESALPDFIRRALDDSTENTSGASDEAG